MKYTDLNVWNNNVTGSTDCVSKYLFCVQYFKNRGQKKYFSKLSKFQNNSRTRLKKWPFSRIIQAKEKFQNSSKNSRNSRASGHPVEVSVILKKWSNHVIKYIFKNIQGIKITLTENPIQYKQTQTSLTDIHGSKLRRLF